MEKEAFLTDISFHLLKDHNRSPNTLYYEYGLQADQASN